MRGISWLAEKLAASNKDCAPRNSVV